MSAVQPRIVLTLEQWQAEGRRRFGPRGDDWRFVCPCCGHEASVADWVTAGAKRECAGFSCVGRWSGVKRDAFTGDGPGPCNYAGGGLFKIAPVTVRASEQEHLFFAFAGEPMVAVTP